MRSKWLLPIAFIILLAVLIVVGLKFAQQSGGDGAPVTFASALPSGAPSALVSGSPSPGSSPATEASVLPSGVPAPTGSVTAANGAFTPPPAVPTPVGSPSIPAAPDLAVDASGLSKATVVITTNEGVIKFKFYPQDAPNTVNRIVQLIQQGFYNGLNFHRVVPGFVVQGGDPQGNGTGGSGQKLKAEFNNRHHIEGTVAMARAADPDSADSQFYITLAPQPHLDRSYTVFGQVTEGMDVVRKLKIGDKMLNVHLE